MEIRLSLLLLVLLLTSGVALSASRPHAVRDPQSFDTKALIELEDAAAVARGNLDVARQLTTTYLRLGQPGLAIAAVRHAPPELARDPVLTHRLSQAYEASGRVEDALNTAQLAFARCATPGASCNQATMAALEVHLDALATLQRWGVQDPRRDSRTGLAYQLAQRTARIASLGLVPGNSAAE
ncbi:MAG: hypothetical protein ABW321_27155 [Polyangiales bacterium]